MATALYLRLDSILTELQNWNIVTPVGQFLDKAERYFNKVILNLLVYYPLIHDIDSFNVSTFVSNLQHQHTDKNRIRFNGANQG